MEQLAQELKRKNIITTEIVQIKEDQNKLAFKKLEENISDDECKQINEVAKYYKDDLHFLGLQLWQNSIKLSQISMILKDIGMMHQLNNLQIDIRQNKIGKNGVESLTNFIKLQKNLKTLGLSLTKNLIGEQGAQMIGYCLQDLPQLESLEIFLTDNVVGQDGFSILMSGVENLEKLSRFIMRAQNCRIKDVGANSMFYILSKKNTLKELIINLDANSLTNAIVEDFQQMMNNLQSNLNVFELSVCQNGLTTEGIKSIMEYAVKPQNLERLRLFLCFNINTSPQFFPKELGLLSKLKILSLGFEDMLIGDIQAKEIFGAISQLENLHTMIIHLGQNVISSKSYLEFQKMILQLQYLTLFYYEFRDNNIMIRKHELNKIKKYVYDKYANVLSAIAYEKFIKQQLIYKSDFSHWDLSMG
ncbi:kinase domain protein (macronuclear) [Tetrahymena thermophila SB210]|uniref:Kinase domain protein n=1 Tax=Tetrahymena thermophila (strain SB210) TaxID=312017 RepID=Q24DK9_TETTS|nr:kinase domain protein [Tetrahymena thermophila SB210]EAS05839.2 kinase domain protein [Tetrahymena thermophila SB210]|eukprot:XP_001026084.2 kinase domain protein [Tetrahymena thermophila SB210]